MNTFAKNSILFDYCGGSCGIGMKNKSGKRVLDILEKYIYQNYDTTIIRLGT